MNGISEEEAVQLFEGIRKNSQSDGIAPYADLVDHYQVVSKTFNIFDLQYQKGISFAEEKFSFK